MRKQIFSLLTLVVPITLTLIGCSTPTTDEYEATALTSYTWQVKYAYNLTNEKSPRVETFATTSLLNRNGLKPSGTAIGPDDKGLWWPTLPPRPSVDEVEQRQKPQEEASKPELLKAVEYKITYRVGDQKRTLPTNYQVYRQVVKAYPSRTPLQLTLGIGDNSVEKAEPVRN
ncbi:hypothetical protein ACF3DV_29195 [Chlorogloeopsis fritschii PCC 9212]|uniref:Lipoprotein n=1 Tax=Chlorogloeopsis fritschii PCC 6912 TaxID=211165 RepID=A0A3S1A172_CHLFR|nr:hypothetical protein [Chlorogloeopsis fritschii]MBF2004924.1 hypothetical protein [Chlorogloeopsis fritschii C42_A2020_084]RUR83157.1 hypothetical protein PCC6912_25310 [Chlorogloeopsis fritschii PCC 6912]